VHIVQILMNNFCIPEIYNTNISHQLFDNKITFVYQQIVDNKFKRWFCTQKPVLNVSGKQNINLSQKYILYCYLPEDFNTDISHQLFYYKITLVYQKALIRTYHTSFFYYKIILIHNMRTQIKRWFCTLNPVLNSCLKISGIRKQRVKYITSYND